MKSEEYIQYLEDLGIFPKKYVVGDKEIDGHDHVVYLRDDVPVATSTSTMIFDSWHHRHSIDQKSDKTLICNEAQGHIHTKFTEIKI